MMITPSVLYRTPEGTADHAGMVRSGPDVRYQWLSRFSGHQKPPGGFL